MSWGVMSGIWGFKDLRFKDFIAVGFNQRIINYQFAKIDFL